MDIYKLFVENREIAAEVLLISMLVWAVRRGGPLLVKQIGDMLSVQRDADRAERTKDRSDVRENLQLILNSHGHMAEEVRILSERVYVLAQEVSRGHTT